MIWVFIYIRFSFDAHLMWQYAENKVEWKIWFLINEVPNLLWKLFNIQYPSLLTCYKDTFEMFGSHINTMPAIYWTNIVLGFNVHILKRFSSFHQSCIIIKRLFWIMNQIHCRFYGNNAWCISVDCLDYWISIKKSLGLKSTRKY